MQGFNPLLDLLANAVERNRKRGRKLAARAFSVAATLSLPHRAGAADLPYPPRHAGPAHLPYLASSPQGPHRCAPTL